MSMLVLDSANKQLSDLLELVCIQLQLTDTQYHAATTSYEAVGEWLSQWDSPLAIYRPEVFAQGSMSLGTTVKPRQREEFDVDLVCVLRRQRRFVNPVTVYNDVLNRIKSHETYREMVEAQERCIVLKYAGQYQLDIIPACPAPEDGETALVIPDREQREWVQTNPKGYNGWFASKAVGDRRERVKMSVEPLPPNLESGSKATLQRAVQLFKRRRDIHFNGADDATRSIVLTTIDAEMYQGEESLFDAVTSILSRIESRARSDLSIPLVPNPTNPFENLAADWQTKPARYLKFVEYAAVFQDGMRRLQREQSMEKIAAILNELFDPTGTGVVNQAIKNYTDRYAAARDRGDIRMGKTTSALTTSAAAFAIPKSNFFGD
jgi:hypothetical protein